MIWNDHSKDVREGDHAFLSASKYHWINYDEEKLVKTYLNHQAAIRGTQLHQLAYNCIVMGVNLPRNHKTLNMYVNDAIGFKMEPEQVLYYSENCYGTADAISFKKNFLRVHDLKTGVTPASLHQLEIYAALFCLEYNVAPGDLSGCELRIYKDDDILIGRPEADDILPVMDKIIQFDKILEKVKEDNRYE